MFAESHTALPWGLEAVPVKVECARSPGMPTLQVVGLARGAVRESLARVRAAFAALDLRWPPSRTIINLHPTDVPKAESGLDLAIALSMLCALGLIPQAALNGRRFFGALGLDGSLTPVANLDRVVSVAIDQGDRELIVPADSRYTSVHDPRSPFSVIGAPTLAAVLEHLAGYQLLAALPMAPPESDPSAPGTTSLDDIAGLTAAKWALAAAAAGDHNLLLYGPPGAGKTLLAQALRGLLPSLGPTEAAELGRIYAAAGLRPPHGRPFRAPHHSASYAALSGGGNPVRPGEVTLSHGGVLFLDELPEFARNAIEALREPLEAGTMTISRAQQSMKLPAEFRLVAAMNPCPCGSFDPRAPDACVCEVAQVRRYQQRVSGPLLDRMDLQVRVERLRRPVSALLGRSEPPPHADGDSMPSPPAPSAEELKARVMWARARQLERWGCLNARVSAPLVRASGLMSRAAVDHLEAVAAEDQSPRAVLKLARVAMTLADLDREPRPTASHIDRALSLRTWGRDSLESWLRVTT